MSNMDGQSFDNVHERIEELKRLFPEAVSEGRLDYDILMTLLGDEFDNDDEKYQFTWKGKLDSLKLAQKRSSGTLRPDFNESRNWETTGNLYIEGDNLEVLKLLQQSYLRQVKMIYIDPPYNTGNDFVYEDDFADPIARYKEITGQGMRANPETAGRYHSNWLSMMYPRLRLAKTLLRDDGAIFISCDDGEQANLRKLCDEVFGEENFVANIMWQKRYSPANDHLTVCPMHDFILLYRRSDAWHRNLLARTAENDRQYRYEDEKGVFRPDNYKCNKTADERPNLYYPIINPNTGEEVWPSRDAVWRYSKERHAENVENDMVFWGKEGNARVPSFKRYRDSLRNGGGTVPSTWWTFDFAGHNDEAAKETSELIGSRVFSTPKPIKLLSRILQLSTNPDSDDVVLDFFAGSCATAHAVMQLNAEDDGNRKFIMVQIPEPTAEGSEARNAGYASIADIGKERIRRASEKIQREGVMKWKARNLQKTETRVSVEINLNQYEKPGDDFDGGFCVFKLDTSNQIVWDDGYIPPDQIEVFFERMEQRVDSIKPDRRAIDMVYEIMLKYGQSLTESIAQLDISGKTFYVVGEIGRMFICLEPGVTAEMVEQAAAYTPGVMIFATNCFADSSEIINAGLILDKAKIEFRWV